MLSFKSLRQALLMGVATLGTTAAVGAIEQPAFAQEVMQTYNIQAQDLNSAEGRRDRTATRETEVIMR